MPRFGLYDFLRGVSDFAGSFYQYPDCLETYASKLLTAELNYWDEPKAQALKPFSSSACLIDPTRYILGDPIEFSLSSKYQPGSLRSTCSAFSLMVSALLVNRIVQS